MSEEPRSPEQLRAELDSLRETLARRERQLYYSKKMASLGSLVAGIAHEIKTPVGAVNSTQDTLQRAIDKLKSSLDKVCPEAIAQDRGVKAALRAIEDASRVISSGSERTLEIVTRIRKFARSDEVMQETDIHSEIDDTLLLLNYQLKNRIEVEKRYGEIPRIVCNTGQINQVFLNVLVNAAQAIPERGKVTITTRAEGDRVYVEIEDSGVGIPPQNLERIFERGFTTKGPGAGTGLGLAICKEIVEKHRGDLSLESGPDRGTKVTISLATDLEPSEG